LAKDINLGSWFDSINLPKFNTVKFSFFGGTTNGTAGNDLITTAFGNNTINSGDGNDVIIAAAGNDKIYAGNGNDIVYGGNGDDYIDGGSGTDIIWAGLSGNKTVMGGDGTDIIISGSGNDRLDGGAGIDFLWAGTGNDTLISGEGFDVIFEGKNEGNDTLVGDRQDLVMLYNASRDAVSLSLSDDDLVISFDSKNSLTVKDWKDNNNAPNTFMCLGDGLATYSVVDVNGKLSWV
jgi:Ca2+-binding RTX toxin-like protein